MGTQESSASDADRQKRVDTVLEYDNGIHFSCGSSPLQYPYNSGMQRSQIRRHRSSYSNGGEGADVRKSSLRTSSVIPRANLSKLSTVSLRKYITIHRLSLLGQGREDLLAAAVEHFDQKMEVTEDEVIRRFSAAAKRHVEGLPQMLHA